MNTLVSKRTLVTFYIASIGFILLELLCIILNVNFLAALLPLVALIVYWALFSLDRLMLFIVFCTPLSINLFRIPGVDIGSVGVGMALPTEPIMFGIMLLFILHLGYSGIDKNVLKHPLSIIIIFSIVWLFITACTSTIPFVSFKFLIQRCWGVATFYFLGIFLFKKVKNIYTFQWLYVSAFTIVIIYTFIQHSHTHFSVKGAQNAVSPFYNDHTAYGALLAMFAPVVAGLALVKRNNKYVRITAFLLFFLFLAALADSFSRAAWVSFIVAIFMLILMLFKVKLKWILTGLCAGMILFSAYQTRVIMSLKKNSTDVSQNITKDIQSISNISTDASNRERLNRWSCGWRMFLDKPILGYGPGTYMFKYAPYQLSYMKTIISTDLGTGGNAHSEYLGPLSEQGLLGMLAFLGIVITVIVLSFRLYYSLKDRDMKITVLCIFLGLLTYFVHGFMNNFLDTDKAAVPFWAFLAMLVAIDFRERGVWDKPAPAVES